MKTSAKASWARLAFIVFLALILLVSPTMQTPLKVAFIVLLVGNVTLLVLRWPRKPKQVPEDDGEHS
ncbi:hypothetical protein ACQ3HE_09750 [Plantibacter auratus]|uniref:hypothetical protein n=1 Tax=Plantibacter auratus TaxID=272914 RepID=UPI003D34E93D